MSNDVLIPGLLARHEVPPSRFLPEGGSVFDFASFDEAEHFSRAQVIGTWFGRSGCPDCGDMVYRVTVPASTLAIRIPEPLEFRSRIPESGWDDVDPVAEARYERALAEVRGK